MRGSKDMLERGTQTKEMKAIYYKDNCSTMFTLAQISVDEIWDQSRGSITDK